MVPRLESAEYVREHTIRVRFADGTEGEIELTAELWGEVFEPLNDRDLFRRFRLDLELDTVTWPSGADLAPEILDEKASQKADAAGRPLRDRG